MKFYDINGNTPTNKRFSVKEDNLTSQDLSSPETLAEVVRRLSNRVRELEATLPPGSVEYEEDWTAGEEYTYNHGLGSANVRYFVTFLQQSSDDSGGTVPKYISATDNQLVVEARVTGRVIFRIEPSQNGFTPL